MKYCRNPAPAEAGAKLGKAPASRPRRPLQGVESVGEPDVDIDDHGTRPDCAQRGLADRDWMLAERPVEVLVQQNPVLPEGWLVADHVGHGDFGLHETAAALDLRAVAVGKEGKGAARRCAGPAH